MTAKIINEVKISTLMETVKTEKRYFWPSFDILIDISIPHFVRSSIVKTHNEQMH